MTVKVFSINHLLLNNGVLVEEGCGLTEFVQLQVYLVNDIKSFWINDILIIKLTPHQAMLVMIT